MTLAMVVEDDEDVRALFKTALERAGFEIIGAASVREAVALLEKNTPDICFIDMNLPEYPGTKVLEFIRATPRLANTKTVVVTANTHTNQKAEELGADLFLVKPVPLQEMMQLAQRLTGME
jgi:CheY-like chemotaxis protein